jgi:hypothetical protein
MCIVYTYIIFSFVYSIRELVSNRIDLDLLTLGAQAAYYSNTIYSIYTSTSMLFVIHALIYDHLILQKYKN